MATPTSSKNEADKKLRRMQQLSQLLASPDPEMAAMAREFLDQEGYVVNLTKTGLSVKEKPKTQRQPRLELGSPGKLLLGPQNLNPQTPQAPSDGLVLGPQVSRVSETSTPSSSAALTPEREAEIRKSLLSGPGGVAPTGPSTVPAGRTAFSMGAPALDDSVDSFGRTKPGVQSFVRGLFAASNTSEAALRDFKKLNPTATASTDPNLKALEDSYRASLNDAQASVKWASMPASQRQSVLETGRRGSENAMAGERSRQFANEVLTAQQDRGTRPTNLLQDLNYYNETGVMRGGAGEGTSTTAAGGVISQTKPTTRTLQSPYGSGSLTLLSPLAQAMRPEGKINGERASKVFQDLARQQGTNIKVGGTQYSPPGPEETEGDYAKRVLDETKRKAELERRKFANTLMR